jgi:hypothetical protein
MEANKWEVKSHSHQIADTGDYDGYHELTNGVISLGTKEDDEETVVILQELATQLNNVGINLFDCKADDLAIDNHLIKEENEQLRQENSRLKQAQQAVWVKATERMPEKFSESVIVRDLRTGKVSLEKNMGHFTAWGAGFLPHKETEWLDESSTSNYSQQQLRDAAHEREIMIQAFDKVRQIFEGRKWVMDGRGCYPYNDDRYKEEVRYMYDEFDKVFNRTWGSIKSKSADYRQWIIENHTDYSALKERFEDLSDAFDEVRASHHRMSKALAEAITEKGELKEKAAKMEAALLSIKNSPVPANEREMEIWYHTADEIAREALEWEKEEGK